MVWLDENGVIGLGYVDEGKCLISCFKKRKVTEKVEAGDEQYTFIPRHFYDALIIVTHFELKDLFVCIKYIKIYVIIG